jgi:hypothetical protein
MIKGKELKIIILQTPPFFPPTNRYFTFTRKCPLTGGESIGKKRKKKIKKNFHDQTFFPPGRVKSQTGLFFL